MIYWCVNNGTTSSNKKYIKKKSTHFGIWTVLVFSTRGLAVFLVSEHLVINMFEGSMEVYG